MPKVRSTTRHLHTLMRKSARVSSKRVRHVARRLHHHVAKRPHEYLSRVSLPYAKWHQHRHHNKVHYGVLATYIVLIVGLSIGALQPVFAATTWTQSDWSGGVGTSSTNQYSSSSGITVNGTKQLEITPLNGWPVSYNNWARRKKITVNNTNGVLTNYQVRLVIPYDTDMQANFNDLRFTNASGTALDFWLQDKTDSTSAIVWVEVDTLVATGNTDIYMYYGNTAVASASNGVNTFIFFDDFSTGSLDMTKWQNLGTPTSSVVGGELKISTTANGWNKGLATIQTFPRSDLSLEMKYRWTSNNAGYDAFMMGWHDSSASASYNALPYASYNAGAGTCSSNCPVRVYEDGFYRATGNGSWTQNLQYLTRVKMKAAGGAIYQQSTDEGNTWVTIYQSNYSNESNLRPGFALYAGTHMIDDLRIRKTTTGTEPTPTIGSEVNKYSSGGVLTSSIFDATFPADWSTISFATSGSGTVTVKARSDSNSNMSTAANWSTCGSIASGSVLANDVCVTDQDQYLQYQVTLNSITATSIVFQSINFVHSASDQIAPITNASNLIMLKTAGGANLLSNSWTNGPTPYFSWSAGADNSGGSGVKGYCLYLGQDIAGDPVTTKGNLGTSPLSTENACQFAVATTYIDTALSGYIGSTLTSSNLPYYLNVKVIDIANNVFTGSVAQFKFRYDNTVPINPTFISAPSNFVATKNVTLTWPTLNSSAASDANSGVAGLQYRIGNNGIWYGDGHTGSQDNSDLLADDGSYTMVDPIDYDKLIEGNNLVYFRTYDNAGNVSNIHISTVIKLNTVSPSMPQNLVATPVTNTTNSFAFSWVPPATYTGPSSNITYCYTVNSLPTVSNCTFTSAGATSLPAGPFATQPADNTFYLVAKDEAGNINYATMATTTFTANTSAPGIPLDLEIADVSTKSTANWKLAISWSKPSNIGAGIANYRVTRSNDNVVFTEIASTAGSSYVDSELSQSTYYYRIIACDSANNCGVGSSTASDFPTGRFTSPASIVTNPSVQISTRSASIVWATDRDSDSRIQIGTGSGQYQSTEAATSTQTKNHTVDLTNLSAGTSYYYKAKWTDEDGNTGTTTELSFKTLPAPTIKNAVVKSVSLSSATLQFVATDAIQVKVFYGLSDSFGGLKVINTSTQKSTYTIELPGLNDGVEYFYKINTVDVDGNEYDSGRIDSFTTPARPRISNLRFQPVAGEPTSTQKVSWTTNVPASSLIRYSTAGVPAREIVDTKLKKEHEVIIRALQDDSNYTLVARSRDKDGNLAVSDNQTFRTALDTRPPKVSALRVETTIRGVGTDARGQLIVAWKTDEPATGQVSYAKGVSGSTYTSTSVEDGTLTTDHTVVISDLATSQVYHVQAISRDKSGNTGKSKDSSAIIGQASDSIMDIIFSALSNIFGL